MAKHVLIADDCAATRQVLARNVRWAGIDDAGVHPADDGLGGEQTVADAAFDLILADLTMSTLGAGATTRMRGVPSM